MKTRSVVIESPGVMIIKEFDIPKIGNGDLLLKVEMTSICGTDPKLLNDKYYTHTFPLIPGHEVVGHVHEIGDDAIEEYKVNVGDRVIIEPQILCKKCKYCLTGNYHLCQDRRTYGVDISCDISPHLWGSYGEYMFVAAGSKVHKIREDVPMESACLSSVIGNGIRWIRTIGEVRFGESVVILGSGAQGLSSVIAAKEAGAYPIIIVGRPADARRFEIAKDFGADYTIEVGDNFHESIRERCNGELADVVVDCSGSPEAIASGIDLLNPLGRFVIAGMTGPQRTGIEIDKVVVNELKILGGCGQSWDVEIAVEIINSRKYPIESIISHTFPVLDAEKAIHFINERPLECVKVGLISE